MAPYDFEETLETLHQWHSEKHDTIQLYTTEVQNICVSSLLAAQIRHSPITRRIKTWDSAKGKIQQQKLERLSLDDMKRYLHDFGGIRISVYFPGDVDKVVKILQEHLRVNEPKKKETRSLHKATFGGYRATHIMVRLRDSEIPQDKKAAWKDVEVEIQIATLVMNVWSEIEHDMIYKPRKTLGQEISEDERRLLDLINGIVMIGEVALRQLEASTQERLSRDANNDHTAAFDWHGLAVWIGEYHRDKNKDLGKDEWNGLKQLYGILDATKYNQRKRIYALLDSLYKDPKVRSPIGRRTLPALLLKHFCDSDTDVIKYVPYLDRSNLLDRVNFARHLGLQILYSLSIAIYLGIGDRFSDITQIRDQIEQPLPSLVEFLDLMHPTRPRYDRGTQVITRIADFCQFIHDRCLEDPDLKICIELPRKGLIAHGITSKGPSRIIFPSLLLRIFPLMYSHNQCEWGDLRILDSIREQIHQNDQLTSNDIVVRGQAASPEPCEKIERPLSKQFFLPTEPSSALEGQWRLEDLQDELELELVYDWKDEHRLGRLPQTFQYSNHNMAKIPCDALKLAYRMYPEEKYDMVSQAWENAYSFLASSEGHDIPVYTEPNQSPQINTAKSKSPSAIQKDKIRREASPTPVWQSPKQDELDWDPLVRPRSSHSDQPSRYEISKRGASPFLEPADTSWASGRAKTLEPDPLRGDNAELLRTSRSITPGPPNFFPSKFGTPVTQSTLDAALNQAQPFEQFWLRSLAVAPARTLQNTTGMRRKVAYGSPPRNKKRKLE